MFSGLNFDFNFSNDPDFWLFVAIFFVISFWVGYFWRSRESRTKWLIEQANLKTQQILELEKVNKEMLDKNRELYSKELALTMANKHLQSLEDAKSKFVSVTTHQLRTPLAAIKWTLDMAAKGQLGMVNDEQKKFLGKGLDSTNRVISIVNDLLKIDSIDEERSQYEFHPTDLIKLIGDVLFEFHNQAEIKKIRLNFVRPETNIPFLDIDADKIRIAIENLVDNAIKYTIEGGEVSVIVSDNRLNSAEGAIEISISDTGIGISSGDASRIFQKFFRAGNAIQKEPDGSGLGLFIARDIIEKHRGAIWFKNRPDGQGTIFTFTLPLHQKKV